MGQERETQSPSHNGERTDFVTQQSEGKWIWTREARRASRVRRLRGCRRGTTVGNHLPRGHGRRPLRQFLDVVVWPACGASRGGKNPNFALKTKVACPKLVLKIAQCIISVSHNHPRHIHAHTRTHTHTHTHTQQFQSHVSGPVEQPTIHESKYSAQLVPVPVPGPQTRGLYGFLITYPSAFLAITPSPTPSFLGCPPQSPGRPPTPLLKTKAPSSPGPPTKTKQESKRPAKYKRGTGHLTPRCFICIGDY